MKMEMPPQPNTPNNKHVEVNRKSLNKRIFTDEFNTLREHIRVHGVPETPFYAQNLDEKYSVSKKPSLDPSPRTPTSKGAPVQEGAAYHSSDDALFREHGISSKDLDELRVVHKPSGETIVEQTSPEHPQEMYRGLNETEIDHYIWLQKIMPVVEAAIRDIQEEINTIKARWPKEDVAMDIHSSLFKKRVEDDDMEFNLSIDVHELSKELALFRRDYAKLANKIKTYTAVEKNIANNTMKQRVLEAIEKAERETYQSWFDEAEAAKKIEAIRLKYEAARTLRTQANHREAQENAEPEAVA